jgi:hypothetical protein
MHDASGLGDDACDGGHDREIARAGQEAFVCEDFPVALKDAIPRMVTAPLLALQNDSGTGVGHARSTFFRERLRGANDQQDSEGQLSQALGTEH